MAPSLRVRWALAIALLSKDSYSRAEVRSLQTGDTITQVGSGDGVHVVTIAQTLFGTAESCDTAKKAHEVNTLFATWLDPDTLEETCGLFKRNADACFQETVAIGCDPATNTATVNVYMKDETFVPARDYKVPDPKIGKCKLGNGKMGRKAMLVTETFDCGLPDGGPIGNNPGTCTGQDDTCSDGHYCRYLTANGGGYECTTFASEGESCGGRTIGGSGAKCDPSEAYCFFPRSCRVADIPGVCTAYIGDGTCTSNDDCASNSWCEIYDGRCKEQLAVDVCCDAKIPDQCAPGLDCSAKTGTCFELTI